jgi:hypothetical protein
MALTIVPTPIVARKNMAGTEPPFLAFGEASTQTFKKGEIVYLLSSRINVIASATPAIITGVAHQDASGVTDAEIGVWMASPTQLFEGNIMSGAAQTTDYVSVVGDFGISMGIKKDTTYNVWILDRDTSGATNARVYVYKPADGAKVGDTQCRALFTFLPRYVTHLTSS